ncbi:MAG: hypothetical protein U1E39_12460 [Planctomycetota bacterium]
MASGALRSLPTQVLIRLRSGHAPEDVEDGLIASGMNPGEARGVVKTALETHFRELERRSKSATTTGIIVTILSAVLSLGSLFVWKAGGLGVIFIGGLAAGIGELVRGERIRPTRPAYLDEP